MKINDFLLTEASWADHLKNAANKIFDLVGEKEVNIDQAAKLGSTQLQQAWGRMVNNLRSHYGQKLAEKNLREQLLGLLAKTGVEFWPYHGSGRKEQFAVVVNKNTGEKQAGTFGSRSFEAFENIIAETLAGRETGGAVRSAFEFMFKEAVNTQQRNQMGVERQKGTKSSEDTKNIKFKDSDYGAQLQGRLAPLNDPTNPAYENAVLPVQYLETTLQGKSNTQKRVYVLVNGKWYYDINVIDEPDQWTLEPFQGDTSRLNTMLTKITRSANVVSLDKHDLGLPYIDAKGSRQGLIKRIGTAADEYVRLSSSEALMYRYGEE